MEGSLQQSIADALLAYKGVEAGLAAAPPLLFRAEGLLREAAGFATQAAVHTEQVWEEKRHAAEPHQHADQQQQPFQEERGAPDVVGGVLGANSPSRKQGTKRKADREPSPEPPATLFVGISKCREGWRAKLKQSKRLAGKDRDLGTFPTREEAARAYDRGMLVVQLQHSDRVHAILNFPLDEYLADPDPEVASAAAIVKARIEARQAQRAAWRALQHRQQAQQPGHPAAAGGTAPEQGGLLAQEPRQKRKQQTRREQLFQVSSSKPDSARGRAAAGQQSKPAVAGRRPAVVKEPAGSGQQGGLGETEGTAARHDVGSATYHLPPTVGQLGQAAEGTAAAGLDSSKQQQQQTAEQSGKQRREMLRSEEALPTLSSQLPPLPQQQTHQWDQLQVHRHGEQRALQRERPWQQRLPPVQLSSPRPPPLLASYGLATPAGPAQRQPVSPPGPADREFGSAAKMGGREHATAAEHLPEHSEAVQQQQQPACGPVQSGQGQQHRHQHQFTDGNCCGEDEQARRSVAPPRPQAPLPPCRPAPKPPDLGQDSWQHAAQAWRQKHMPTAHELRRAQQGRRAAQARPHADQTAHSAAAGPQRGSQAGQPGKGSQPRAGPSADTSRKAGGQALHKQQQQQQQQPWRLLSVSLPASQLPQRGRQVWLREQHQLRVAGCVTFDAVLRAFGIACDASSLREAYRQAVRRFHPDSNSQDKLWATADQREECEEILKIINQRKPAVL